MNVNASKFLKMRLYLLCAKRLLPVTDMMNTRFEVQGQGQISQGTITPNYMYLTILCMAGLWFAVYASGLCK